MCNSNEQKASECEQDIEIMRARARASTWVWSLNNAKLRVRDKVWDSDMRGEVLLVFWYVQGSIYIIWNFEMKSWQPINFTACVKDRRLTWKYNLQNYHIRLIMPVQLSHDLCNIFESPGQSWAKAVCWHSLAILIYQHSGVLSNCLLNHKTSRVMCSTKSGFAMSVRCQPKIKIIGNDQNWSAKVRIGHVILMTCDTIMWLSANGVKMWKYANREPWFFKKYLVANSGETINSTLLK
jgi:hypothetical protein